MFFVIKISAQLKKNIQFFPIKYNYYQILVALHLLKLNISIG